MITRIIVTATVALVHAYSVCAQNESGHRQIDIEALQEAHQYYDSTTRTLNGSRPIITSIPPIGAGRPASINNFYILVDSLLRYADYRSMKWIIDNYQFNDTLKYVVASAYNALNYDPFLFQQFALETELNTRRLVATGLGDSVWVGRYVSSLWDAYAALYKRYKTGIRDSLTGNARLSMFASSVIAKVKILDIDSIPDFDNPTYRDYRYVVKAELQDVLQGSMSWSSNFDTTLFSSSSMKSTQRESVNSASFPTCYFTYHALTSPKAINIRGDDRLVRFPQIDTMIARADGAFALRENESYVVFLTLQTPLVNDSTDFFQPAINSESCLGALYITQSEFVRDLNNVFLPSTQAPYAEFKSILTNLKNQMLLPLGN